MDMAWVRFFTGIVSVRTMFLPVSVSRLGRGNGKLLPFGRKTKNVSGMIVKWWSVHRLIWRIVLFAFKMHLQNATFGWTA